MSDNESFETSSGSEAPNSPNALAESRRDMEVDRTISWMTARVDCGLAVLAFRTRGACGEDPGGSVWPQAENRGTSNGPARENRKRGHEGGSGLDEEDNDGNICTDVIGYHRSKCIRCRMSFKSSEKLLQHSQADIACNVVRDESGQKRISHEQLMKLNSKKRNREASSDYDKWIHIYKILFPNDYLIPSPYFQRGDSIGSQKSLLSALREHVCREPPRLIRPRLKESVDPTIREAVGPDVLEVLVRDVFAQAISTFSWQTPETLVATQMVLPPHSPPLPSSNQMGFPSPYQLPQYMVYSYPPSTGAPLMIPRLENEQAESSQQASQHIDVEALKRECHSGESAVRELELWPSNFLQVDKSFHLRPDLVSNTIEGTSLSDLFNFEDFHDECAA